MCVYVRVGEGGEASHRTAAAMVLATAKEWRQNVGGIVVQEEKSSHLQLPDTSNQRHGSDVI